MNDAIELAITVYLEENRDDPDASREYYQRVLLEECLNLGELKDVSNAALTILAEMHSVNIDW